MRCPDDCRTELAGLSWHPSIRLCASAPSRAPWQTQRSHRQKQSIVAPARCRALRAGASMEPRKAAILSKSHLPVSSFNGAAADQPRKEEDRQQRLCQHPGFNGAAADQPRKERERRGRRTYPDASMEPRLISRGRSDGGDRTLCWANASMEPRLISRGRDTLMATDGETDMGFNGAAADQPRKVQ